jgi:hypothetical protein
MAANTQNTKSTKTTKASVKTQEVKAPVVQEAKVAVTKVTVEGAKVISVTSPSTIDRIAKDKQINPQEVFVRCTFEYKGNQFTASNKLRFLTKAGYLELLEAKEKGTEMKFVVDIEKEFFYIEHDVAVDSLFETPVAAKNERASLSALLGA